MRNYPYHVVDVFTETPLEGNPLAVLPAADGLDGETMQRIAREFNLSETVFILPSERIGCTLRFRIFTPTMEMRFAGHPTIGGAFVALQCGLVADSAQHFSVEEPLGEIALRVQRENAVRIWLRTPPIVFGAFYDRRACAEALGIDESELADAPPQLLSAGNPNIYVALRDPRSVDRAWLDLAGMRRLHDGKVSTDCMFLFAPIETGAYSRMFAPEHGVVEDPATGSATGPLAAYMMKYGLIGTSDGTSFISEQGTKMGRRSLLHVEIHGINGTVGIEVGGNVVPIADGTLHLP